MKITYFGHSCFLIESGESRILFDPFISPNPLASSVDIESIKPTHILLSHGHEDHVADVERIGKASESVVVASYEVAIWFSKKGLNYHPMNTGGKWDFGAFQVKCVNAVHSSTLPDGSPGGPAMGFVVWIENKVLYYSGDTSLTLDMKLIGEYHKPDLAFLCMGDNFTMGYEDAVLASDFVQCNEIVGMHFDTFGFVKMDHNAAAKAFESKGKNLRLLAISESFNF
jgi:L-ascorbate metabolism protein UlaG (beta-lactamase superfamily)